MLKRLKDLFTDSATYGLSHVLTQMIGFLLLPFYTRYLTTEDYGVMAMLAIITLLFVPIGNLGLSNAIFRQFNLQKGEEHKRRVTGSGLLTILSSSAILLIICEIFIIPISDVLIGKPEYVFLAQLTVVRGFMMSIARVPQMILRAERKVKTASILNIVKVLITIPTIIYLIMFLKMGILGFVLGSLIGEGIYLIAIYSVSIRSLTLRLSTAVLKPMLTYGLPFLPKQLQMVGLTFFSQFVVRDLLGLEQAGLYAIAVRFSLPIYMMVMVIGKAWEPLKFQIQAEDDNPALIFRTIVNFYLPTYYTVWVLISLWGNDLLRLMTTSSFHEAGYLIPVVALTYVLMGIYNLLGTGISFADNMIPLPIIQLFGTITVVVGSYLVVPHLGAIGAALVNGTGWLVIAVLTLIVAQRRFHIDYDWKYIATTTILTIIVLISGYYCQDMQLIPRLAALTVLSILFPLSIIWAMLNSRSEGERVAAGLRKVKLYLWKA